MQAFHVLSDPSRRKIVTLLSERPHTVAEINAELSVSPPAVSQHLKVLRESGLVTVEIDAQRRIYHLNLQPIDEAIGWLTSIRSFWEGRLDALERELAQKDKKNEQS